MKLKFEDRPYTYEGWSKVSDEQYASDGRIDDVVSYALLEWHGVMEVKPPVVEAARKIAVALGLDPDAKGHFGTPLWYRYKKRAEDELIAIALGYTRPIEMHSARSAIERSEIGEAT